MKTSLLIAAAVLLTGCVSPSAMLVNRQGQTMRCATTGGGYGIAGAIAISAANRSYNACVSDYQRIGFVKLPDTTLGNFYNTQHRTTSTYQLVEAVSGSRNMLSGLHLFKAGFDLLYNQYNGTSASKPVKTPEDLSGFKIRVPASPLWTSMFKAFGASPTTINFNEVYTALQTKVVDGQENPLSLIDTAKLYEVQKFVAITNHMWDGFWFLANKKAFEAMPANLREVVEAEFNTSAVDERNDLAKMNETVATTLKGKGLQFVDTDAAAFRGALKKAGFYEEWKGKFGAEAWAKLEQYSGKLA